MEIMNYAEMVNNAKTINYLAQKTIQCSQDYVESKKNDILEQMMEYIYVTLRDFMSSGLVYNKSAHYISKYLCGMLYVRTGAYAGDGTGACIQVYYSSGGGVLRVYMNEEGFWFSQCGIDEQAFEYLVRTWSEFKINLDKGLRETIEKINRKNQIDVERQLALHEVVKNFQV